MTRSAASLLEELQAIDESATIEAKAASKIDRSVMETVCAFANEPGLGGGYLLLGVVDSEQSDASSRVYQVVGVPDPDQIQSDLASQCASTFNRPVRPRVIVERLENKPVVVVFVPEMSPTEKPVFIKNLGLPRGAFRRVGSTDQEGTEDDLIALYQAHQVDSFDGSLLRDADLSDIDPEAIRRYRELRTAVRPAAEELGWSDQDLLRALGGCADDNGVFRPTVAGLLMFGTVMALRRCFPMMRIDYIRVPGREWVSDPDRRFETVEIRAPLPLAIQRAVAAVQDDLPVSFSLPEGALARSDETLLPIRVLREAIVNAAMHRSYRIHGAIQILRYANRLEIRNPGYSLKAEGQLGEPGSKTRNPKIAAVLHDLHIAETKGSGIRVMRELMLAKDLVPPTFESDRRADQFIVTLLFHHFLGESDLAWLRQLTTDHLSDEEMRALVFVREVGAIDNASYRNINRVDTLNASKQLKRLRDLRLLEMKGAGSKTYYVPGANFKLKTQSSTSIIEDSHQPTKNPHQLEGNPHQLEGNPHQLEGNSHQFEEEAFRDSVLPPELKERLEELSLRPRKEQLRTLIRDLCALQSMSARDLAKLLKNRDPKELVRDHLGPMVEAGELVYTIPEMPNHPHQKYAVPEGKP